MIDTFDEETLRHVAQRAWTVIYGQPGHPTMVAAMGEFAVECAEQFRDGKATVSPFAVRQLFGPEGILTLCMALSTLVGPTSAHMRQSVRGLVDQCAWPAQFGKAGRATYSRAERVTQARLAQACLDSAAEFLAAAERSPVDAIMQLMTVETPDTDDYRPTNRLVVGLTWVAAWRLSTTYVDP